MLGSDDLLLPGGIETRLDYLQAHPGHLAVFAERRDIPLVVECWNEYTHERNHHFVHGAGLPARKCPSFAPSAFGKSCRHCFG